MLRYARLAVLVSLLVVPAGGAEAATGPVEVTLPPAVAALLAHRPATDSLRGTFTLETQDVNGGGRRHGDFAIVRGQGGQPTRYHFKMAKPDGSDLERHCSDGQRSWKVAQADPGWPMDVQVLAPGADADFRRVADCLLVETVALMKDFLPGVENVGERPVLILKPRTEDLQRDLASIRIHLSALGDPEDLAIDDGKGTVITVRFAGIVRNGPLEPALFRVE